MGNEVDIAKLYHDATNFINTEILAVCLDVPLEGRVSLVKEVLHRGVQMVVEGLAPGTKVEDHVKFEPELVGSRLEVTLEAKTEVGETLVLLFSTAPGKTKKQTAN